MRKLERKRYSQRVETLGVRLIRMLVKLPESIKQFLRGWNKVPSDGEVDLDMPMFDGLPVLHQLSIQAISDRILKPGEWERQEFPLLYLKAVNCCAELIDLGADVNTLDEDGKTAIWWATLVGNSSLIKLLLNRGAIAMYSDSIGRKFRDNASYLHRANLLSKFGLDLIMNNDV